MGSPARLWMPFQTITSEYDREEPAPGKHYGDAGLEQRCQLHKRHNAFGHFSDEHQTRWGNSAMICPTTKKLNRRCCASVASVWRSIPVQRRMEKDL